MWSKHLYSFISEGECATITDLDPSCETVEREAASHGEAAGRVAVFGRLCPHRRVTIVESRHGPLDGIANGDEDGSAAG